MKKIKLLSLFSGVGAFEKALERLGVEYDLVNYCEVDKYASKAYALIHNCSEDKNLGDITKVNARSLPHDIDLITYGFPCQDISLAGKQKGFTDSDGNKTRSGLFFDALRIIDETKPKVAIAENVKNLVSKKFKNEFEIVLNSLDEAGYNSYYKVLNAKDCGIPQNRERVFIVSIRKDIDPFNIIFGFPFPEKEELKLRLKDMLEDEVDEKYYLSNAMIKYIVANNDKWTGNNGKSLVKKSIASTINTGEGSRRCDASNYVSEDLPDDYDLKEVILIKNRTKKGYIEAEEGDGIDISGRMQYHRGTVQKGVSQTLSTAGGNNVGVVVKVPLKRGYIVDEFKEGQAADISFPNGCNKGPRFHDECPAINITTTKSSFIVKSLRIRKLTPKECWRLMGFDDKDVDILVSNGMSNTQLYKQAGNSIVVDVLVKIFSNLFNTKILDN